MNPRRLFIASCLALITSAFSFQMRQNIADDVGAHFHLTKELVGSLMGGQFLGMALAMLVFSFLCDILGMGKVLGLGWLSHLIGITGTVFAADVAVMGFAPSIASTLAGISGGMKNSLGVSLMPGAGGNDVSFWMLWLAAFFTGAGNGLVEISINPLAATIYPEEKTHKLNVLHAWWPGGLIVAGLLATFLIDPLYGKAAEFFGYVLDPAKIGLADALNKVPSWQVKYGLVWVPMALYGLLSIGQHFPATERVQANVSAVTMFLQVLRPLFILWAFCMVLTASTELGTNAWMESVLKRTAHVSGTVVFVYMSVLVFVLRFFAGPIAHKLSPTGMLFVCSIFAAAGLYALSFADTAPLAFGAATLFALGYTYYWPTMLGVTADRFPKGGAFLMGLMGFVGNMAISQVTPLMGAVYDSYTVTALPENVRQEKVPTSNAPADVAEKLKDAQGNVPPEIPLVDTENKIPTWVPPEVSQRLYPAGGAKVDPDALSLLPKDSPDAKAVADAEVQGAVWAFRWTSVMPAVLVVIFGLIALVDKLRGGYKAVHIHTPQAEPVGAGRRPSWGKDDVFRR